MQCEIDIVAEVGVLIYPDCQLAAVHGLTDLFRIAGEWVQREPDERTRMIRVSHWEAGPDGVICVWDSHPDNQHRLSYVIAPPSIVMPQKMQPLPAASTWLSQCHTAGVTVCSVCAGAFVLAETGLINGRRATTHWAFAGALAERFPTIELAAENMVIDDGDIITAGGILAWTDLGLMLVEKLHGHGVMLATARFLLIDPPRRDQSTYKAFIPKFDHGDMEILRVQHHIHAQPALSHSIAELSECARLAERTFQRRFARATKLRPTEYMQQVRIMKARDLLETTNRPIDQIAWTVGYSDAAAFRKIFGRITGFGPNLYRRRFGIE